MKAPGMYYCILAAVCILMVCVGMVSAAHTMYPSSNSTSNRSFIQPGCNMTKSLFMNPMYSHKEPPAMNRMGEQPGIGMNRTITGYNSAVRTLHEGGHPPSGGRLIRNTSAHNPASGIALCGQNGENGAGPQKSLLVGNLTRSRDTGTWQAHGNGMQVHMKNQSPAVSGP